ncbi:PepSY-associated TM helix domain-containing protein [soil metagenome]
MIGKTDNKSRSYWLKTLHQWHWISSALCLLGMLLFAVTGLTLNNAGIIDADPKTVTRDARLPDALKAALAPVAKGDNDSSSSRKKAAPLPGDVIGWADTQLSVDLRGREAEWSDDEVYIALPRPGGDAWLRIDRQSGDVEYETTDRGWISYLNDLHKGRHTGTAWSWFLDVFSVACLVFTVTGLLILKMHANNRAMTWPMVGMGVIVPLVLAMIFIH